MAATHFVVLVSESVLTIAGYPVRFEIWWDTPDGRTTGPDTPNSRPVMGYSAFGVDKTGRRKSVVSLFSWSAPADMWNCADAGTPKIADLILHIDRVVRDEIAATRPSSFASVERVAIQTAWIAGFAPL